MNVGLIFFQFLPLLLYIGFERWKGFRVGIIAAIIGSVAMLAFDYLTTGAVDQFTIGECFLILALGVTSLKMNSDRFFKFQPTVVAVFLAAVFLYFELKGTPLLVRYIPHIEKYIATENPTPEIQAILDNLHSPHYARIMATLSRVIILLLAAHAAVMAYAALYLSTSKWFFWRLMIYPGLLIATIIAGAITR